MSMVLIPAQTFLMGSDDGRPDERPVHRVSIDAFEIGITQVTNGEYASFANATGHPLPPTPFVDPEQPVVAVSWFDAVAFCEWQSEISGRRVRLPTEAEWECAARGGAEGMLYPWGNELPPRDDARCADGPDPVGRHSPNAYELYDLCENVHEWCSDWYSADFYSLSPERNPRGPEIGTRRASRGGSWRHQIKISRCAARSSIPPAFQYADYGFRIARDVET
ncbi:MAG TPA: formylglycine-generating enzyme family protein [Thermoanaerobaculia bacterium]|jgi:sulfatase modifying factor 1|nr:formylglycine-generating enzyme family protein [Thermoanaerobaculia bacterium]